MSLSDYLNGSKPESSLRLNLFIVTVPTALVILTLAFHITWITLFPVYIIGAYNGKLEYITRSISWVEIAAFVTAFGIFVFQLWYGKKLNKDAENKTPPDASQAPQ